MKGVVDNLTQFKLYDKVLSEIYGFLDPTYDFKYLINSLKILDLILKSAFSFKMDQYN